MFNCSPATLSWCRKYRLRAQVMKQMIAKLALACAIVAPLPALAQDPATPATEPAATSASQPSQEVQEEMTADPVQPVGIFGEQITGRWTVTGDAAYGQSYTDNIFVA